VRSTPTRLPLLLIFATFELVNGGEHFAGAARSSFSVASTESSAQNVKHSTGFFYITERSICAPQKS